MGSSYADLEQKAAWIRHQVFEMYVAAKRGHLVSSLSLTEILVTLYYGGFYRYERGNPSPDRRDRLVVSKGHGATTLYPILADIGFIEASEFDRYAQADGILRMHADPSIPGIDSVGGSLGQGLGLAAGFALAAKRDGIDRRAFAILGDAELYEGSIWETAIFAAHNELDNLVAVVDRNRLAILGETETLLRLEPLEEKFRSFGWAAVTVDGHSFEALHGAFEETLSRPARVPTVVIADTIKGRGISFMENDHEWHTRFPNADQIERARTELSAYTLRAEG
ncbi:MAG: transketolase [Deltaproteobacteria bacterium]|nr:transketolase [Deltaproteobacteria bacterium]